MFCNNCGAQNPDGSNFCSTCGKKLSTSGISKNDTAGVQYTIEIFRESQIFAINPPINLLIKGPAGDKKLSIANGETVSVQLDAGEYELTFSQSIRKRIVNVNLDHDIHIDIKWDRLTGSIKANIA